MRGCTRAALVTGIMMLWIAMAAPVRAQSGHDHGAHGEARAPEDRQDAARPASGDHGAHHHPGAGTPEPREALPIPTDEDRASAFPTLNGQHTVHDEAIHSYVLFNQLEWQIGDGADGLSWDNTGWIGGDVNRFWFRTEGESEGGELGGVEAHALYGRAIARWWDLVAGVRQDVREGPARTWAAIGLQGLAPYWFEVEATAYLGESGRTHFRFETEYELLLTNRLIVQPQVEVDVYGKSDPGRGIGAGLSSADAGLRLRYEVRRELAPYIGVTWSRKFFGTADLADQAGEPSRGARFVIGARVWF